MKLLTKLLCLHKWNVHNKVERKWVATKLVKNTENWYKPMLTEVPVNEITEVFICEHCGKIEIIKY